MEEKKDYRCNIDDVGLYDEAEETEKMMNSLKAEGERNGIKKGIKQGASNEKKSIAKSMLAKKMDIPLISELTGLSKKQITMLM